MSTDDRVTKDDVDNLLEVFEKEQLQRLGALQAVQPLLLRTKRAGSGPLSQAAAVQKLDVIDLHAMAQWVIDGKNPWAPRELESRPTYADAELTVDDDYPLADVTGVPFETVAEVTATVSEEDDGIHVRFTSEDDDPDRTTDLAGEPTSVGDVIVDVHDPHTHPDEDGLWVFNDDVGKCERVETGPTDADGPE